MLVDTRLTWPLFLIAAACFVFPFLAHTHFIFMGMSEVRLLENLQALLLLFIAIFSFVYMKPLQQETGKKEFWLWAVCWWVLLFGRCTSWGRDYFPDVPKIYFRGISIILIAAVIFPLLNKVLRQEIVIKLKTAIIPVWAIILTAVGLIISDAVEHHRFLGQLILASDGNESFIEELYEFPLILGLFIIAFSMMREDR